MIEEDLAYVGCGSEPCGAWISIVERSECAESMLDVRTTVASYDGDDPGEAARTRYPGAPANDHASR